MSYFEHGTRDASDANISNFLKVWPEIFSDQIVTKRRTNIAPKLAVRTQDFAFLETADSVWRQARDAAKQFTMQRLTLRENHPDPQIKGAEVKKPACKTVR